MTLKFTILGCGSSMGVPTATNNWGNCNPNEKKNTRTRCSAIITSKNTNTLIDTSPDLRLQLLDNKIQNIKRVIYTHMHADQTHGINDLRPFFLKNKKKIDVYADKITAKYLKRTFNYCFDGGKGYPPIAKIKMLKKNMIFKSNENLNIKTIPVPHGKIMCMSFVFNKKLAYASDLHDIYKKDLKYFKKLKFLVIDCLRYSKHPAHLNFDDCIKLIKYLKPKRAILTNLHADIDYNYIKKYLPKNVSPGYDGMSFLI
jgi:phosphoribosyl 1,2-cyclic phosphate phosphodiesterase